MKKNLPTAAELEILAILWENGPSTVREIHEILSLGKESGYTTTLKLMQIMATKGLLTRNESQRTHVYKASQKQAETQRHMVTKLLQTAFAGSASSLVMQTLGNSQTTREELHEIKKFLDSEIEKKKGGEE